MLRLGVSCLPQPARAQVPKAASTAQLRAFLKIDIITSFLIRVRESTNENTNDGLPFKTKTSTYNKYYNCVCEAWQEMIAR